MKQFKAASPSIDTEKLQAALLRGFVKATDKQKEELIKKLEAVLRGANYDKENC